MDMGLGKHFVIVLLLLLLVGCKDGYDRCSPGFTTVQFEAYREQVINQPYTLSGQVYDVKCEDECVVKVDTYNYPSGWEMKVYGLKRAEAQSLKRGQWVKYTGTLKELWQLCYGVLDIK